jgi:alkylation response protein AidB-like acyl-CoA dehydrogenase
MDFAFTQEQQMLRDSLQRYLEREYSFEARRARLKSGAGCSAPVWRAFAEMGLLALPFTEEHGGFGGDGVDTMIAMEAFGRALVVEPYLSTVVLCGALIELAGSAAQKAHWLPRIAEGATLMAFAHGEAAARHDWGYVRLQAQRKGAGFVLNGSKAVVLHGGQAQQLIVSARMDDEVGTLKAGARGAPGDAAGVSLFLVDAGNRGVRRRDYATIDGMRAAEIEFDQVEVSADSLLGAIGGGSELVDGVIDRANAALCAEALGAMTALYDATLAYLKARQQFGVPIGTFQVLQHRMVDVLIHLEQARSLTYHAAFYAHSNEAATRARAVSAAKVQVGDAARFISQQAIQLHGGIGMTDELNVGHYVKRLTMINATFGNMDTHLERFAALA